LHRWPGKLLPGRWDTIHVDCLLEIIHCSAWLKLETYYQNESFQRYKTKQDQASKHYIDCIRKSILQIKKLIHDSEGIAADTEDSNNSSADVSESAGATDGVEDLNEIEMLDDIGENCLIDLFMQDREECELTDEDRELLD
jgi:hypothetical protein